MKLSLIIIASVVDQSVARLSNLKGLKEEQVLGQRMLDGKNGKKGGKGGSCNPAADEEGRLLKKGGKGKGCLSCTQTCVDEDGYNSGSATELNNMACYGIDPEASLAPGSCVQDDACKYVYGDTSIDSLSCIGRGSCEEAEASTIDEYACIGGDACEEITNTNIGTRSCVGFDSCEDATNADIGVLSCTGTSACEGVDNIEIGDHSCITGITLPTDRVCVNPVTTNPTYASCKFAGSSSGDWTTKIGDNSCSGTGSCSFVGQYVETTIGDSSCLNKYSCLGVGSFENAAPVVIGNRACANKYACAFFGRDEGGTIEDNSCVAFGACKYADGVVIEEGSCIGGYESCRGFNEDANNNDGRIGKNSCVGDDACEDLDGVIGCGSCWGEESCEGDSSVDDNVLIGDGSCVGFRACNFDGDLGPGWTIQDNACVGDRECNCANPSGRVGNTIPEGMCNVELGTGGCCDDDR